MSSLEKMISDVGKSMKEGFKYTWYGYALVLSMIGSGFLGKKVTGNADLIPLVYMCSGTALLLTAYVNYEAGKDSLREKDKEI